MDKINNILFIVEGKKTEPLIIDNLKEEFFNNNENIPTKNIIVSYGTVIYGLYKKFLDENGELDLDKDTFPILKDIDNKLQNIKRKSINQIYLFFDYDGHASNAKADKLFDMLNLFSDETEKGKLYISYPMVESLRHIKDGTNFKNTTAKSEPNYKKISQNCNENLLHFNDYDKNIWLNMINQHSKKANFIITNDFKFPEKIIEQITIFENQKEKYINIDNKVAVLSAFPIFLLDYYGVQKFVGLGVSRSVKSILN